MSSNVRKVAGSCGWRAATAVRHTSCRDIACNRSLLSQSLSRNNSEFRSHSRLARLYTRRSISTKSSGANAIPKRTNPALPSEVPVKKSGASPLPFELSDATNPEHTFEDQIDFIKREDDNYIRILKKQLADMQNMSDTIDRLAEEHEKYRSRYSPRNGVSQQRILRGRVKDFHNKIKVLDENFTDMQHEHYSLAASIDEGSASSPAHSKSPKRSLEEMWNLPPDSRSGIFAGWKSKLQEMSPEQIARERTNLQMHAKRDYVALMRDVTDLDAMVKDVERKFELARPEPDREMQHVDKKPEGTTST